MDATNAGSQIVIESYKHNGNRHRTWKENTVLHGSEEVIIGANDKTKVVESDGRIWNTREPSIFYFHSNYWFNVIGMLRDNDIYYYCNIGSPFLIENSVLKYIDYDLDIKIYPDMTYELVDEDEYEHHKVMMDYPQILDKILYTHIDYLLSWSRQRKGPFMPGFIDQWYERFLTYS
ncbi:DUF402 domain-containing protein [Virgibacillus sp. W0181]|uniref:DUF402 domain-containing protein n=1 Tax=Virgibacillus sp. W0181 TaxID=3391581 RepID=UPI003F44C605